MLSIVVVERVRYMCGTTENGGYYTFPYKMEVWKESVPNAYIVHGLKVLL